VLHWLGEEDFFNGRAAIWHYGWTGFLDRPIIGWGWMSAWKSSVFLHRDLWWTVEGAQWSHSSYIDVLLGGGVIGAALLFVVLVYGGYSQIENALSSTAGQWAYAMTFFVLLASTQESFVNGNHFLWLLLVASVIGRDNLVAQSEANTATALQEETA
jgi:O-antigen ligase